MHPQKCFHHIVSAQHHHPPLFFLVHVLHFLAPNYETSFHQIPEYLVDLRSFKQYVSREGLTECYLLQISIKETDTKKKKKQKKVFTDFFRNLVIPVNNLKINSIRYNLPSNHFKFLKQTKLISKKNTLGVVGIFHQTAMILISPYIHTDLILAINQTNHDINGHSETQWLSNLGFFSCTNVLFRSTISTIFL